MYKRNNEGWLKHIDFILWDMASLQLSYILAYMFRHGAALPYVSAVYRTLAIMLAVVDILVAVMFNTMHNVLKRGFAQEAAQTLKHVLLVFVAIMLFMFSTQSGTSYSRITIYLTALFHMILGYGVRLAWKPVVRRAWKDGRKSAMILVADERLLPAIIEQAGVAEDVEYTGVILSNRDGTGETLLGMPVVASLDTAADYICREWVDEVFVCPERLTEIETQPSARPDEGGTVAELIEACRQMAVPVHLRLPISNIGGKTFIEKIGGYNVLTMATNYATPMQLAMKRAMDILGGLAGSLGALVVIAVVGPKIKRESPGPILFRQTRIGKNGKRFQMLKIRSMYMDAEERKAELMRQNRVSDGMMFKLDWDPRIIGNKIVDGKRVTGIGEKIRSASWDEWPQFFNVLRGQMSLVGTRPPTVDEWEKYKYHHRARLATKPGLTGLWQVSGRSRITDFEEVVKLDTEYINHWSIGQDIRILLKTVRAVLTKDGAM